MASGEIQLNDADLHTVSQPTVSRAITDVLCALTSPQIVRQFIQFKTAPDHLREQCLQFNEIAGFPKVLNLVLKLSNVDCNAFKSNRFIFYELYKMKHVHSDHFQELNVLFVLFPW